MQSIEELSRDQLSFKRYSSGECWCVFAVCILSIFVHLVYFVKNRTLGFPSIGVDGEIYKMAAIDCLQSKTILLEKCNTLFWTPWYVIIAALQADNTNVLLFNMILKFGTVYCLLKLSLPLIPVKFLRVLPCLFWMAYWPTYDYVIFFHYEIMLAFVCTVTPYALYLWTKKLQMDRPSGVRLLLQDLSIPILLGTCLGIGIFSHSRLVGLIVVVPFCLILSSSVKLFLKRALPGLFVFLFLSILPVLLWGLRNKLLYNQWIFSSTSVGYNLYVGYNEVATGYFNPQPPYPPLDKAKEMALEYIRLNPGRSLALIAKRIYLFWMPSKIVDFGPAILLIQEVVLLPLGFIAVFAFTVRIARLTGKRLGGALINPVQAAIAASVLIVLWFQLFHAIFYVTNPRFRIPVIPIIVLLTATLISRIILARRTRPQADTC